MFEPDERSAQANDVTNTDSEELFADLGVIHSHVEIGGEHRGEGIAVVKDGATVLHTGCNPSRLHKGPPSERQIDGLYFGAPKSALLSGHGIFLAAEHFGRQGQRQKLDVVVRF